jgi:hypothetical protein
MRGRRGASTDVVAAIAYLVHFVARLQRYLSFAGQALLFGHAGEQSLVDWLRFIRRREGHRNMRAVLEVGGPLGARCA